MAGLPSKLFRKLRGAASAKRMKIEQHPMDHFHYRDRLLYCENVPLPELAEKYGTPLFVYSQATLLHHLNQVQTAFAEADPILCFSIKTNANIHIARLMREHGSGFDVTSGGELYRALL